MNRLTDSERLDWLEADNLRLEDVRVRMNNEGELLREAIDALAQMEAAIKLTT